jgi:hypothetical protein
VLRALQRQRYAAFRRFVLGFYTQAFRDLFFSQDPPKYMFRAVVTVLAGYWRPSFATRAVAGAVLLQRAAAAAVRLRRIVLRRVSRPAGVPPGP